MSVWRRKAIECLPENRIEFQAPDTSVYTVLSALLTATVAAHRTGNHKQLNKYYAFAEWCARQNAKELWNAAGVSFYEHLGDFPETLAVMPQWVSRYRYQQVRGLLQLRLTEKQLQELDNRYQ